MEVIYYLFLKIPRPLFILLTLLFLFSMIVAHKHTTNKPSSTQEKQHGYNHSSPR